MIFIKVFQKLSQFSGKVPLEHWVSRIAINTCLTQIESERVRPELRHADLSEEEEAVVKNLAVSVEEIHQITGMGTAAIKVRAFRARQKMKAQLTKLGVGANL